MTDPTTDGPQKQTPGGQPSDDAVPGDDVELAQWLLAHWDGGRGVPKSHLERAAWGDESSHGRHFDRFVRQVLGVEASLPSKQSDRIAELAEQVRSLGGRPRGLEPLAWEDQLRQARSLAGSASRAWNDPVAIGRHLPFALDFVAAWKSLATAVLQHRDRWSGDQSQDVIAQVFGSEADRGLRANVTFWAVLIDAVGQQHLPTIDDLVVPQVQAGLLNLERQLVAEFGNPYSLGRVAAVPLELTRFGVDSPIVTPKAVVSTLPTSVQAVFSQFDEQGLSTDPTFAFRVAAVPVPSAPVDELEAVAFHGVPGQVPAEVAEVVNRQVAIRQIVRPPRPNLNASDVVDRVQARIPNRFTMNAHTEASYRLKVRSRRGDNAPDAVDPDYCEWVSSVKRHLFNERWVERLVEVLSTEAGFKKAVGRPPEPLSAE